MPFKAQAYLRASGAKSSARQSAGIETGMGFRRAPTRRRQRSSTQQNQATPTKLQTPELHRKKASMQIAYHGRTILFLTILGISFLSPPPISTRPTDSVVKLSEIVDPREWAQDYQTRLFASRSLGRGPPSLLYIRWLHSPKTGTSFANTLIRWGCPNAGETFITPRKERPSNLSHPLTTTHSWDWLFLNESGRAWLRANCTPRLVRNHGDRIRYALNMHKGLEKWEVRHAVGLFRMPLQRVYSNYVHLSKHYNESRAPREPLASFVTRTEFWGQQSKLLLGRRYRDPRVLTDQEIGHAVTVVKAMLFVGLTEQFQLSCRLFHAMFGGVPHRAQFENVRPGINRYRDEAMRTSEFRYDESVFGKWRDRADDAVYEIARKRFWNDVKRYTLEIEKDGLGYVHVPP